MSWKAALPVLLLFLAALSGCGSETPPPTLSEDVKSMAIAGIKGYPEVLDAAVAQEGEDLSLAIVVVPGTSEARAKELGDNFVRMVKNFGPGPSAQKEIGEGIYDFLITVAYPDGTVVAQGAKVSFSRNITW